MSESTGATGLRWLWLAALVLVVDLGSKQWVMTHFQLGESVPLVPFFNFTYAHNYGAAFSFLADKGGWQRWLFAVIALVIIVALLAMMHRSSASQKLNNIAYSLIIGGAIGNLADRLVHGYVIDFLDVYVGDWHYPTFNLADSAIVVGALLIVLEGFWASPQKKQAEGK
ncbi:Lipoprotein signal peptidase [Dickeya dianthicola]|uniref:Lipoprotein signal peptidase n=1 Tax=Dickeya dianthicola TaxID=204039 RepID=A0AAP6RYS2_9GAMM|nr:signal peptidase II [Dickeya dianthicola]ATO34780.1 Lipoprotein signal peptidase [Dickeya dianthicola RNS04.9]AYC20625.1 Lipoprotein signal peptidase [Dickeya dianthicola]MBI0436672.1 lipoprotein signal peptidase [Dickeya dianthicola]MBI0447602.1 lipoprotein signal peptidase [Dickeya dianthicola]MBI0451884.1 lipoprotein signal peptidase [Dickeya dianthicola]